MTRARLWIGSVSFALFAAACAAPESGTPGTAGSGGPAGSGGGAGQGTAGGSGTTGVAGTGVAGTGVAGTGAAGTGVAGTGVAGSSGPGVAGSGGSGAAGAAGGAAGRGGSGPAGAGGTAVAGMGGSAAAGRGGGAGTAPGGSSGSAKPRLVTSAANAYWMTATPMDLTSGTADVTVNETMVLNNWDGWGGTFNEMGWDALSVLDAAERDRAMRLLFHETEGLRFTHGRIPIGASDYAMSRYTLNDTAGDYAMNSFSLARDEMRLIPFIKAAQAVRSNIKFWASPWTPPPWMKDNNAYDRGNMKNDAQTLGAFALYLAKFAEGYNAKQIPISAIHPQNEPGWQQDYPSCGWTAAQMTTFIKTHLGPTLMQRNLTSVEIWSGTMSNNDVDPPISQAVMNDSAARAFVKGFGMQWASIASAGTFVRMGLPVWQTEHQCGNYPWNPAGAPPYNSTRAPNDHAYAEESWGLIRDWLKTGVTGYMAWNMVLDTIGRSLDMVRPWNQNALLAVDRSARRLVITPTYHVFRHFSGFIDPGAKRVQTSGSFTEVFAFKNTATDNGVTVVLYNNGSSARMVTVQIRSGQLVRASVPSHGWATIFHAQ
jgi:glucosylceramidase